MTRCAEFYEKWEEEPNFCPMERTMAAKINAYIKYCRENKVAFATLSLSKWFKQKRETVKTHKQQKQEISSVRNEKGQIMGKPPKEDKDHIIEALEGLDIFEKALSKITDENQVIYLMTTCKDIFYKRRQQKMEENIRG